ncbi:hypothetical protein CHUAL_002133 [Chamberlinius hualienensis]
MGQNISSDVSSDESSNEMDDMRIVQSDKSSSDSTISLVETGTQIFQMKCFEHFASQIEHERPVDKYNPTLHPTHSQHSLSHSHQPVSENTHILQQFSLLESEDDSFTDSYEYLRDMPTEGLLAESSDKGPFVPHPVPTEINSHLIIQPLEDAQLPEQQRQFDEVQQTEINQSVNPLEDVGQSNEYKETLYIENNNNSCRSSSSEQTIIVWEDSGQLLDSHTSISPDNLNFQLGQLTVKTELTLFMDGEQEIITATNDNPNIEQEIVPIVESELSVDNEREMIVEMINCQEEDSGQLLFGERLMIRQDHPGQPSENGEPQFNSIVVEEANEEEENVEQPISASHEVQLPDQSSNVEPRQQNISRKRKWSQKKINREPYFLRKICRHTAYFTCILDDFFHDFRPNITHHYNVDFGIAIVQD